MNGIQAVRGSTPLGSTKFKPAPGAGFLLCFQGRCAFPADALTPILLQPDYSATSTTCAASSCWVRHDMVVEAEHVGHRGVLPTRTERTYVGTLVASSCFAWVCHKPRRVMRSNPGRERKAVEGAFGTSRCIPLGNKATRPARRRRILVLERPRGAQNSRGSAKGKQTVTPSSLAANLLTKFSSKVKTHAAPFSFAVAT